MDLAERSGLILNSLCYKNPIDILMEEYGNNDRIIQICIKKLMDLRLVTCLRKRKHVLRNLYNSVLTIIRLLLALGVSSTKCSLMVKSIIVRILPYYGRAEFNKQCHLNGTADGSGKDDHDKQLRKLLQFIKLEVESVEQAIDSCSEQRVGNTIQKSE